MIYRPHQFDAMEDIIDEKKILLADDMGMGKCAVMIGAKNILERRAGEDLRTLVSCPTAVLKHWKREVNRWYRKHEEARIKVITSQNYRDDLRHIKEADFILIGYAALSKIAQDGNIALLKDICPQYGIIDEGHNAKNPISLRSLSVAEAFDPAKHLVVATGTPIPNSIVDIYMQLHLLDKKRFPLYGGNTKQILARFYADFKKDPYFVGELIREKMRCRRTAEEYLGGKVPQLETEEVTFPLTGLHKEVYLATYNNPKIPISNKPWELIRASLDPGLVNPLFLPQSLAADLKRAKSDTYERLDDLVADAIRKKGKVLIFSDLKEGVTATLQQRYGKEGALLIDGDEAYEYNDNDSVEELDEREKLRRKFQTDKNHNILITTTIMNEGVDLTAGTDVIHLTRPYAPYIFAQRNRRTQRVGEIKKDKVRSYLMKPFADTVPMFLDGIDSLITDKQRIIDLLMNDPESLTLEDLKLLEEGKLYKTRHLSATLGNENAGLRLNTIFKNMRGNGSQKLREIYKRYPNKAKELAHLYKDHWEGHFAGNTANMYGAVAEALGKKGDLSRKLDIASGPFSLSRKLKMPVHNIDINPYMLQAGRLLEEEGAVAKGNKAEEGSFHSLPFHGGSFDLATLNLALHYSTLNLEEAGKTANEREQALREMNRVLRKKGFGIITLPSAVLTEEDAERFYRALQQTGFSTLPGTGFYKSGGNFRAHISIFQKQEEAPKARLEADLLTWEMDRIRRNGVVHRTTRKRKNHGLKEPREEKKEVLTNFMNVRTQKSLEESLKELM
jgi:ubiquinone/menaquinone biosynthesis C-methylase UbiE/superfamily II DNA or RNA helicase